MHNLRKRAPDDGTLKMHDREFRFTYIGGPTALFEIGGIRFLTDPTFDPGGSEYKTNIYTLHKTAGPAVAAKSVGRIDVVLLSHDHHFDNLDGAGRALLPHAGVVLTTHSGAERLGGNSKPLASWESVDFKAPGGALVRVTGTPARHGPPDGDRGPVTGFVITTPGTSDDAVYVSGDTVWYEGIAEVARRFSVKAAILNMGAARVKEVGPAHLTFTAEEGVAAARAFPDAVIFPLHYDSWSHFSESRNEIDSAFSSAGMMERLIWAEAGVPVPLEI